MSNTSNLTAKQARFVSEYLLDGNGTRAAVAAGYGAAGAHASASRTLRIVKVQKALQARQASAAARLSLRRDDVVKGLLEAIEKARMAGNAAAMISGWSTIGKMLGFFEPEKRCVEVSAEAWRDQTSLQRLTNAELLEMIQTDAGAGAGTEAGAQA